MLKEALILNNTFDDKEEILGNISVFVKDLCSNDSDIIKNTSKKGRSGIKENLEKRCG